MSKLRGLLEGLATLAVVAALIAGVVILGGKLLGGGDDGGGDASAAPLGPLESSWVPGQPSLISDSRFFALYSPAASLARDRADAREDAYRELEERKREAKEREDAEARRRWREAKRRARLEYLAALREAERKRREQEAALAEARRRYREALRRREEALRVDPGEECKFKNVRREFNCQPGRLPDPPAPKKRRKG